MFFNWRKKNNFLFSPCFSCLACRNRNDGAKRAEARKHGINISRSQIRVVALESTRYSFNTLSPLSFCSSSVSFFFSSFTFATSAAAEKRFVFLQRGAAEHPHAKHGAACQATSTLRHPIFKRWLRRVFWRSRERLRPRHGIGK